MKFFAYSCILFIVAAVVDIHNCSNMLICFATSLMIYDGLTEIKEKIQ